MPVPEYCELVALLDALDDTLDDFLEDILDYFLEDILDDFLDDTLDEEAGSCRLASWVDMIEGDGGDCRLLASVGAPEDAKER